MTQQIRVELPNGQTRTIGVNRVGQELKRLVTASGQLGVNLHLRITAEQSQITASRQWREAANEELNERRRIRTRPAARTSRKRPYKKSAVDRAKLRIAMRDPKFSPTAYAKKIGANHSIVQYHAGKIRKMMKGKKRITSSPTPASTSNA